MSEPLTVGPLPFLKWAGGKSRLLAQYAPYLPRPEQIQRYFEPFLGSAALFFQLRPDIAQLSDQNEHLVELYQTVRDNVEGVIALLGHYENERDFYYQVRGQDPAGLSPTQRAARFIYLNKTCYNGLYRENRRGQFNVPFGQYKRPKICDAPRLRAASQALQGVQLRVADFEEAVSQTRPGDFIYFDPPYQPLSPTSSFTSYHRNGFTEADQQRLATTFRRLAAGGRRLLLSNSNTPLIHELYAPFPKINISARRNINSNGQKRGPVTELLIFAP